MTEFASATCASPKAFFRAAALLILLTIPAVSSASALSDLAAQMQPGEFRELNTNNFGNSGDILVPSSGNGTILEYTDEAIWDPVNKKIYIIGCSRYTNPNYDCPPGGGSGSKFVVYEEATNSWNVLSAPPFSLYPHSYDHAAINPWTGDYYFRVYNSAEVWRYSNSQWTRLPDLPAKAGCCNALEFFPELGGFIFTSPRINGGEFYLLKPGSKQWKTLPGNVPLGSYHNISEYSEKHKIMYFAGGEDNPNYAGDEATVLVIMDANGNVTRATDSPVGLGINTAVHTVDPITGNFLVFSTNKRTGLSADYIYEYNPVTNKWTQLGTHPIDGSYDIFTAATPIPQYGVIMFIKSDFNNSKVYLYKHVAGSGTPPPSEPANPSVQKTVK